MLRTVVDPALQAVLRTSGGVEQVGLPLALTPPRRPGGFDVAPYAVELQVDDCDLAVRQAMYSIGFGVRGGAGRTAETLAGYDPRLLSELLSASCT